MAYTVKVSEDKCIGCSICARICPTGTLSMDKEKKKAYTTDVMHGDVYTLALLGH